jgi:uncharacterized protein
MRYHGILMDVMGSKAQVTILTTLLKYPGKAFSGREIARITGVSKTRTAEILLELEKNNVVNKRTIGITNEWTVNRESILVQYITKYIYRLDEQIMENLKKDIKTSLGDVENIAKLILYGSVARGEETHNSDIDLLVLLKRPDNKNVLKKINELNLLTISKYGNPISAGIYTEKMFYGKNINMELRERIEKESINLI